MLIEDNEKNAYLVTFILEKYGCQVIHAVTVKAVYLLPVRLNRDLILLDIQLPVMGRIAVACELMKNEELRVIPVIAVTSYAMVGVRDEFCHADVLAI